MCLSAWLKCQLLINYPKLEREGIVPKSFYKARITLIPKPDKDSARRKHRLTPLVSTTAKILNTALAE